MASDISFGRLEPDKTSNGGLKAVYFVNYGAITGVTYNATSTDVIDTVTGSPSAYKYDLKGTSGFDQPVNSSRENGTTFFTQTLTLNLKGLTAKDHKEIKLLSYGRPVVIVEDRNGNFFLAGLEHGMEVTGGSITTGVALGDLSGYTLTLTGEEPLPANFLGDTLATVGFTVVEGV
jgi:hypothetical protein